MKENSFFTQRSWDSSLGGQDLETRKPLLDFLKAPIGSHWRHSELKQKGPRGWEHQTSNDLQEVIQTLRLHVGDSWLTLIMNFL